ncbi:hypothetical protein I4U23_016338 [Adineta vaga]|nr:hypothetical protein I4U23_016338 [Adineta vaga]
MILLMLRIILRKHSELDRYKHINLVQTIWLMIGCMCTLIWCIIGSVWTFDVKNQVQFNDIHKPNYCHPGPYWYAFVLCILWYFYVIIAIICIPYLWKWKKKQIEKDKRENPLYFNIKY